MQLKKTLFILTITLISNRAIAMEQPPAPPGAGEKHERSNGNGEEQTGTKKRKIQQKLPKADKKLGQALYTAAANGDTASCTDLLARACFDKQKLSRAFMLACAAGHLAIVKLIHSQCENVFNECIPADCLKNLPILRQYMNVLL